MNERVVSPQPQDRSAPAQTATPPPIASDQPQGREDGATKVAPHFYVWPDGSVVCGHCRVHPCFCATVVEP